MSRLYRVIIFVLFCLSFPPHLEASSIPIGATKMQSAKWIWHPDVDPMATNRFIYFRQTFEFNKKNNFYHTIAYFAADANARLIINGQVVRRKVTRYHPEYLRPEKIDLDPYLKDGTNVILVLHHNWGAIKNFQRQAVRRGGFLFAEDIPGLSDSSWRCAVAPQFTQHEQQIIGVIGDLRVRFPMVVDGAKVPIGLSSPDYRESTPLEWKNAVEVKDGPWKLHKDLFPNPQREYFVPVRRLLAAGNIEYPEAFSTSPEKLRNDVSFPAYMELATYRPNPSWLSDCASFPMGEPIRLSGKSGETVYLTFDFHQPIHGYPVIECETKVKGAALSLGYGELNVSPYDGTNHVDPETGWIKTQGVVGTYYGDRYLTAGNGKIEKIEFPDERTARYLTLHVTFPEGALDHSTVTIHKLGIVKSQYPVTWKGDFTCGDPIIDQIVALSKIHAEITMSDTYVDTPGREDGQWLEDIRPRAQIAETWMGDNDLRFLTLLHAEECREDGRFLSFAPQSFVKITGWDWGMQWIAMLYDQWKWTAFPRKSIKKNSIDRFYLTLQKYVDLLLENVDEEGLFRTNNVFADIRVGSHPGTAEDVSVIVHAWLIERLQQAVDMERFNERNTKQEQNSKRWAAGLERMIQAFHKNLVIRKEGQTPYAADVLYAKDNRLEGKSQAAQISAILAGLFTPEESRTILDEFFPAPHGQAPEGIAPWNNPTYLYRALKVLSDNGLGERALAHLKWRMSPYLPGSPNNITPLKLQGPLGGPLPEYFVTHQEMGLKIGEPCSGQPGDPTGSHGWNAVALIWLHDSLLGVSWDSGTTGVAGDEVTIAPNTFGLPFVSGHVITPKGEVYVHWNPSRSRLEFEVPEGVKTVIRFPKDMGFHPKPIKRFNHQMPSIKSNDLFLGNGWSWSVHPKEFMYGVLDERTLSVRGGVRYQIEKQR